MVVPDTRLADALTVHPFRGTLADAATRPCPRETPVED